MPDPNLTETLPTGEFEPMLFWEQHKGKILLYGALFIFGLAAFGVYQFTTYKTLAETEQRFAQAKTAEDFQKIIADYPASVAAANSSLLLAEKLRGEKKYEEALEALRTFTARYPEHPLIGGAWLAIGGTLEAQGKMDEALQTYQQLASKYPTSYAAPLAAFSQANILKQKGKSEEARHAYENLIAQFPKSYFSPAAMREMRLLRK